MVIRNAVAAIVMLSLGMMYGVDDKEIILEKQDIKEEQRKRVCKHLKRLGLESETAKYDGKKEEPKVVISIGGNSQPIPLVRSAPVFGKNLLQHIQASRSYRTTY